ncbi:MAG: hypothetical protein K2P23_11710, partial [Lachnospiraceae bacterium]|nr:hypothetical protein [Lachnospiraceae bacterium]
LGMVIAVSIILCLLLLWQKNVNGEQKMKAETVTETPEMMLAGNPVEELKQQYLMDVEYFGDKIKELSETMTRIQETLETTVTAQEGENVLLKEKVEEITGSISGLLTKLQNTEKTIYDLNDLINVMDAETVPAIQKQIVEIEKQIGEVGTDISAIYNKIDALETTDKELKIKIREIQGALKTSIEQNISDITNRFEGMNAQIQQMVTQLEDACRQIDDTKKQLGDTQGQVEDTKKQLGDTQERVREINTQMLRFRYDNAAHTLYLYENQ